LTHTEDGLEEDGLEEVRFVLQEALSSESSRYPRIAALTINTNASGSSIIVPIANILDYQWHDVSARYHATLAGRLEGLIEWTK